ncbi:Dabb family protein [Niveibacterium sp. 24ML]|uniref:Dabb family protein n=1 Tax=Niveibacterium sp. 24ML TaxID=2985512 RepID=UPI00226FC660|nr:Dabb family protein [Niveibacterium sp. 24ML]MCX9155354.1 Dabb family protein [Niveibacterium sp. 24ML]
MIRHLVLVRFRADAGAAEQAAVIGAFRALPAAIAEVLAFEDGANVSPEGLAHGFDQAFLLSFATAQARDAYLVHQAHTAFVAQSQPVIERALVFDWETA